MLTTDNFSWPSMKKKKNLRFLWRRTSQLKKINVAETKELIFCSKQEQKTEQVSLDGQPVEAVDHFK